MEQQLRVIRSYQAYLRLIMWHMLNKRLIWKLLRTIGNILCGISWWGGHNWWACCWGWVHHGTLMMLVLPLLGHIWYCRKKRRNIRTQQLLISIKYTNMVHKALHWLGQSLPLQCHVIPHPSPFSHYGLFSYHICYSSASNPNPLLPGWKIFTCPSSVSLKATFSERY